MPTFVSEESVERLDAGVGLLAIHRVQRRADIPELGRAW